MSRCLSFMSRAVVALALCQRGTMSLKISYSTTVNSSMPTVEMHSISSAYGCTLPKNMNAMQGDTAEWLLSRLRDRTPFSLVRYGDGEWLCAEAASGGKGRNRDGLKRYPDMCRKLRDYTYKPSLRRGVTMTFSAHICMKRAEFVKEIGRHNVELGAWYATFGLRSFLPGLPPKFDEGFSEDRPGTALNRIMMTVQERGPVVVVGPKYLSRLHRAFGHVGSVHVPNSKFCGDSGDAWTRRENITNQIRSYSQRFPNSPVQFLCAGGMAMKVIIMDMASKLGHKDSFIDIGSTFDSFAGAETRPQYGALFHNLLVHGPVTGWFNTTDVDKVGC